MKIKTYSKLNLYLKVFPRRSDGFHDIVSVMQTIDLADEITFTEDGDGIVIECDSPFVPVDGTNTIAKAYRHLRYEYPALVKGVRVSITKRIPPQSGLAGGSGNAAGAIIAFGKMFNLPLDHNTMLKCALSVGSDVPFMLAGGCAIVWGRGEFVEKLPGVAGKFYVLVIPQSGVSTKGAYDALDEWRADKAHKIGKADEVRRTAREAWLSALPGNEFQGLMHNDFEEPVSTMQHGIADVIDQFKRYDANAFLTGSGSAVYAPVSDDISALNLLEKMREIHGDTAYMCEPVATGVEIDD